MHYKTTILKKTSTPSPLLVVTTCIVPKLSSTCQGRFSINVTSTGDRPIYRSYSLGQAMQFMIPLSRHNIMEKSWDTQPTGPSGTYFEAMGVTPELCRQVLSTALAWGEDCELYFQHLRNQYNWQMEKSAKQARRWTRNGGLNNPRRSGWIPILRRFKSCCTDKCSTHCFSNRQCWSEHDRTVTLCSQTPNYYPVETGWDSVNMLTRVQPAEMGTNGFEADSRVKRVDVFMRDGSSVVILWADGKMVEDWRPSTMGFIQCTVEENGKRESGSYNVAARGGLSIFQKTDKPDC